MGRRSHRSLDATSGSEDVYHIGAQKTAGTALDQERQAQSIATTNSSTGGGSSSSYLLDIVNGALQQQQPPPATSEDLLPRAPYLGLWAASIPDPAEPAAAATAAAVVDAPSNT